MAQNTSYSIGQYTYDPNFEYITLLGTTVSPGQGENYTPLTKSYVDYKPDSITTYRDVAIKLPENIEYRNTYYMKLSIPKDSNYNTIFNLKLCAENNLEEFNINFNKFQQIKQLTVSSADNSDSLYSDVILFEYTKNSTSVIDADIPKTFNGSVEGDQLYYNEDTGTYKYCLASGNNVNWDTYNNLVDIDFSSYSLLQSWKLEQQELSNTSEVQDFYFIFSPKYNLTEAYKYLWLEVVHENDQVRFSTQTQQYDGKTIPLDNVQATFYKVNNLLAKTEKGIAPIKTGINTLNNIMVTAPENWVFAINGEEIRINATNQYKLDDFEINSLGIVGWLPDESENDWKGFLIDYGYKIEN